MEGKRFTEVADETGSWRKYLVSLECESVEVRTDEEGWTGIDCVLGLGSLEMEMNFEARHWLDRAVAP